MVCRYLTTADLLSKNGRDLSRSLKSRQQLAAILRPPGHNIGSDIDLSAISFALAERRHQKFMSLFGGPGVRLRSQAVTTS
jgi:ABC-type transporter Mla subunit MlaD